MALPVNAENGKIVYEVPYGKLEVGKDEMKGAAGERYQVVAEDIHPRAMQNWINVSSDNIGVTNVKDRLKFARGLFKWEV